MGGADNLLASILSDKDKMLVILLIILLYKQGAGMPLLLALAYIII